MLNFLKRLFDSNEKQLKKAELSVKKVNELEVMAKRLTFDEMKERISKMKDELKPLLSQVPQEAKSSIRSHNREKGLPPYEQTVVRKLHEFLPEVFAFVREVEKRKYSRRHFDVQILAGTVLAWGNKLIEVKTGEGKTQVFHLPTALYALSGRGAHVVTVNEYLARRDGEYAGHIMSELGLSVGVIIPEKSYKFIPDSDIAKVKGEDVYKERQKVEIKNPGDVRGWNLQECSKKEAYSSDIVYGTNNEFGFDYLRDNMASSLSEITQRELYYCIVDEVDSILIDEARTPLIISAPAEHSNVLYEKFAGLVPKLEAEKDYTVDEKSHSAVLTDEGVDRMEKLLGVKNLWEDYQLAHHLENALRAFTLYKKDDEYIVKDGQVLIVDQFTGRVLSGRRYSEGLHQAIEAKEGVEIKQESKTLATITFQNFFRLYKTLSGGSGTVMTEAEEFYKIYTLDSIEIPTNEPVVRADHTDRIYKSQKAKFDAVTGEIIERHKTGQPMLVGTTSIENSEYLSRLLDKAGVVHEVLNAKRHEKEAHIVENAGQLNTVTIATNMAGRGTDIRLGEGVAKKGGLCVIGTERHEARRIDNQLRGRTGRQGDPGESRFYVALDDEIMRIQGGDIIKSFMERANIPDDLPIESRLVSGAIERAQKRMESYHFDIRNNLVKYDDVMNQQREIFYQRRRRLLEQFDLMNTSLTKNEKTKSKKIINEIREDFLSELDEEVNETINTHFLSEESNASEKVVNDLLDIADDELIANSILPLVQKETSSKKIHSSESTSSKSILISKLHGKNREELSHLLTQGVTDMWKRVSESVGEVNFLSVGKLVMLQAMDELWSDHLDAMSDLREGIGLRGIASRDPLVEYKNEAFRYFDMLMKSVRSHFARRILKVKHVEQQGVVGVKTNAGDIQDVLTGTREMVNVVKDFLNRRSKEGVKTAKTIRVDSNNPYASQKIGRNDPCPCGSGKKYKKCHGRLS